ncbi:MAG: DUF1343 domain-containing protein [Sulfolobales archaeon]|nr:DUF1343 domain-containing protein [Sulfolobales archaeon]
MVLGVDRFLSEGLYRGLAGRRIAVLCNQSSLTSQLTCGVCEFRGRGLNVEYVLVPEHGFWGLGDAGEPVPSYYDPVLRVPVRSVYPGVEGFDVLDEVDAVLVDIQDVGIRFYTYVSAALQVLEEASRCGVSEVLVLDRPNPLSGSVLEGPVLRSDFRSYVGYCEIPLRYGLTLGELSLYYNSERRLGLDLRAIPMLNYSRSLDVLDLDTHWVPPSPAIPDRETVFTYPSLALLEGTNVSEGRGTYTPFKIFGAPFVEPEKLCGRLNSMKIPEVLFRPTYFKPRYSKYSNSVCGGAFVHVINRKVVEVVKLGLGVLKALYELYSDKLEFAKTSGRFYVDLLLGTPNWRSAVMSGDLEEFVSAAREEAGRFRESAKPFILYS